jgi:hypothetical protein
MRNRGGDNTDAAARPAGTFLDSDLAKCRFEIVAFDIEYVPGAHVRNQPPADRHQIIVRRTVCELTFVA